MNAVSLLTLIGLTLSTQALAGGKLTFLRLDNPGKGAATACAPVSVFTGPGMFSAESKPGYVIKIFSAEGDSIFKGLKDNDVACVVGLYRINTAGFAPSITLPSVSLVKMGSPAKQNKPPKTVKPKTMLEFELTATYYKGNKEVPVSIQDINGALKAKKAKFSLPTIVKVTKSDRRTKLSTLQKQLDAASELTGIDLLFSTNSGFHSYPAICYRGPAAGVEGLLNDLQAVFFEDEFLAIRYKNQKHVILDEFNGDEKELSDYYDGTEDDEIGQWVNFNEKSDSVLVMSNLGPNGDGTELYAKEIKPCR